MFVLQVISIILLFLLGFAVLVRKLHDPLRGAFFLVTFFIGLWIFAGIFASQLNELTLFWNRLTFAAAFLAVYGGYLFVRVLTGPRQKRSIEPWLVTGFAFILIILALGSGFVVNDTIVRLDGSQFSRIDVDRGIGYSFFIGSLIGVGALMITRLIYATRKATNAQKRNQLRIVLYGFIATLITGLFIAFLLPTIMQSSAPSAYSYLSGFMAVGSFMYAIRRHQLFDIRFVIARAVAYILLLVTLVFIYALTILVTFQLIFGGSSDLSISETLTYLIFGVFFAFTYNPLKQFFDKVTDKLFFRQSYDRQEVLSRLGSITAGDIDVDKIATNIVKLLHESFKPEFVSLHIGHDGSARTHSAGVQPSEISSTFTHEIDKFNDKVVVTDFLGESSVRLHDNLQKSGVYVAVRLAVSKDVLGYVFLGQKRSGDMYNLNDKTLLSTIGNELSLAIQNALRFEEIQNFNATLQEKVDSATHRLQRANARLRQLDATKDEFVSMASHQLRTPLTSIKGYLSMVLEGDAGKLNPTQEKLLHEAFTSSERMVRLIGDFLNVSRLRTGRFVLEKGKVNLADLVEGEVAQLESSATTRGLKLIYEKPENFPIMDLDKNKIQQVVMNFIDNALFYSKSGGKVRIELLKKQNEVILKVKDSGIGVPAHEKRRIFTKFYRASNARKQRPDGTGIGLFMAQKVIVAHGGSVIFESTEGKGSTFGFHLPIVLSKEEAAKAAAEVEKAITE